MGTIWAAEKIASWVDKTWCEGLLIHCFLKLANPMCMTERAGHVKVGGLQGDLNNEAEAVHPYG